MSTTIKNSGAFATREAGRPAKGSDNDAVERVAGRILEMCTTGVSRASSAGGVLPLPSERELSQRLSVTRHVVRNALEHLEDHGDVQRVAGRAALVVENGRPVKVDNSLAVAARCINFVQGPSLKEQSFQTLLQHYLTGYTEVLDRYDAKTRFLFWEDERRDYSQMLWNRVQADQQACILVNRAMPGLLSWLGERSVPFVVQYYRPYDANPLPPHHKVYVNKTGGAFDATRHLLELGHRKIGYIGHVPAIGVDKTFPSPTYDGYRAAMTCAGLTPMPEHLKSMQQEIPQTAFGPCLEYLKQADRPTAVVTANAGTMNALLEAAQTLDLRVPRDLSVVGFSSEDGGNESGASYVDFAPKRLAHASVELLMEVLEGKVTDYQTRILQCKLRLGRNTASPTDH